MKIAAIYLICSSSAALAFSPPASGKNSIRYAENALFLSAEITESSAAATTAEINNSLQIPLTYNEMVSQVSECMSDAYEKEGLSRQIVRILLPRDANNDQLGQYYEAEAQTADRRSR